MSATITKTANRTDVYTRVTDHIVAELERGVRPWFRPWGGGGPVSRPLRFNGQPYQGINVLMLWASAEMQGLSSPFWLTFNQARQLGGHVKKGEHGSPVVFASSFKKKEAGDDGSEIEQEIHYLKQYLVFNSLQCDCLPQHFYPKPEPLPEPKQRIERAELFFANTKAEIRSGGSRAYYSVAGDYIQMPPFEKFRDAESHVATIGHESVHWSGASHRLNRAFGQERWGDAGYAMEELVAELGSAFLCADLQITPEVREDHASYIQSWIKLLSDKRAIFTAASHASKAVDYLHSLQPQPIE